MSRTALSWGAVNFDLDVDGSGHAQVTSLITA